ncbi:MAG: HAMP domain-containing histidine kinase, partial [Gemmatimonadota bacterium]|nr:HAMP domain-containing histidine kinase [Gemmatimonadota bacterium]
DEFLANLSTDLRAPLAELVGYISRIESGAAGPVTEGERTALLEVKASGEVLLDRIGDLIELSELKRNEVEPAVSVFDVREPMREALALVVGRREGVALQSAEPEAGVTMASDRRRVVRLLSRLLRNAYAFTERGAVRTAVEVHDDRVVYRVEDTGVGIPVDAQRTVFEEFRRAGAPARPQEGGRVGAGLGLPLVRRTARLLGGDVLLVSEPGEGSSFRVELPLVYEGPVERAPGARTTPPGTRSHPE